MRYRLEIRPDALADIEKAADWYDKQELGLGNEFARDVLQAIDTLPLNPLLYRVRHRRAKRAMEVGRNFSLPNCLSNNWLN